MPDHALADVKLAVTEACTNVVVHAYPDGDGPMSVTAGLTDGALTVVVSDEGRLSDAVDRAIEADPDVAAKIRDGKIAAAGALIGAVMKEMKGQADASRVRELILQKLG